MQTPGISRKVDSNQIEVHDKLEGLVEKYRINHFAKPISSHTQQAFQSVLPWLQEDNSKLILDACCGVGESTVKLAERFGNAKVLGVDKSIHRLDKHHAYRSQATNYKIIRADLLDLWRLLSGANLHFTHQFLLYPNPYPKSTQIQKRWYASAVMPFLMELSNRIVVRSNWRLYLEEFTIAAKLYDFDGVVETINNCEQPFTPFERKYLDSGQTCFQLVLEKMAEKAND